MAVVENERVVQVPVSVVGCVVLWIISASLLTWDTFEADPVVGKWGLFFAAAAAGWTSIVGVRYNGWQMVDSLERRIRRSLHEEKVASLDAARY